MNRIILQGCQTQPLASYLKALGVLRLVAEQADPTVQGCWNDEGFELRTSLSAEELESFFLNTYRPTPVIAPWNGGSGYYPKDSKIALSKIVASSTARFEGYRDAIQIAQQKVNLHELDESPKDAKIKNQLLNALRAELNDSALDWLDAALSLSGESQKYPPLLGTGGNDGRLDFTNNFMQRLVALIDDEGHPTTDSMAMLGQSLFDLAAPFTKRDAIGQFAPGTAGSPNGSTGFVSSASASPWDYVLMIEGAMLFASSTSRRLESHLGGALSFPFTTRTVGAGSGAAHAADEANARAEIWLPIWSRAAQLHELKNLFSEGRVTLSRRNPRDGLEFARAVSQLGSTRGISAFERYAFLMRAGKAFVATPVGRYNVPSTPNANLLSDLEKNRWLGAFDTACRDKNAPARLRALQAPLRDQMFAFTQASEHDRAQRVQAILQQLGEIESYAARSPKFRENVPPLRQLDEVWAALAEDTTTEYQISAAIASLHMGKSLSTRQLIAPVEGLAWQQGDNRDLCWQHPEVARCMARALDRLTLRAQQKADNEHGLSSRRSCDLATVASWLRGDTDDRIIHRLVPGLALSRTHRPVHQHNNTEHLPYTYRVLKLLCCGNAQAHRLGLVPKYVTLPNPRPILRQLQADNIEQALTLAERRLRIAGLALPTRIHHPVIDAQRLSAALLIPLHDSALQTIAETLNPYSKKPPQTREHAQGESA